jgi:hypothetical protein
MKTLDNVWHRREVPRASMSALDKTEVGTLRIGNGQIDFDSGNRSISVKMITNISYGRQGNDFVNRWIKIDFKSDDGVLQTAFLKDGYWRGWRPILTHANSRILTAIRDAM